MCYNIKLGLKKRKRYGYTAGMHRRQAVNMYRNEDEYEKDTERYSMVAGIIDPVCGNTVCPCTGSRKAKDKGSCLLYD